MPDLTGYTRIEAISLLNLLNVEYEIEGFGYVTEQSINVGDIISTNIKITLKQKHEL